jgi:hypothetical protein
MRITKPTASRIMALVLFLSATVSAQNQKKPDLPADHPDVYYSFFFFMDDFGNWLNLRATQQPAKQAALLASAARYLQVDVKELPKLISTCQSVTADLRQVSNDAHQYSTNASVQGKAPEPGVLQSYEAKRQATIQNGISQVQQALTPISWNGVHSHINGTHRASIHVGN